MALWANVKPCFSPISKLNNRDVKVDSQTFQTEVSNFIHAEQVRLNPYLKTVGDGS